MSLILDGTNGETLPSWTTATRPASPVVGQMGYNTTTGNYDAYTASGWTSVITSTTAQGSTTGSVTSNGPAFSAYASSSTAVAATTVLVGYQTKVFDTAGAFNNTGSTVTLNGISVPAYAFAPPVAGYYQVNASWATNSASAQYFFMQIYKNASTCYAIGQYVQTTGIGGVCTANAIVYLNGTGDYIQGYTTDNISVGTTVGLQYTYFQASLVRTA